MHMPLLAAAGYSNPIHLGEVALPLIAALAYLTLYTHRLRTLARERRPVPGWRVCSFVFGVVLMLVVPIRPVDDLADSLLVAHLAQHIVIGDIASLFIVLGLTGPVLQPLLHMRVTRPLRVMATP